MVSAVERLATLHDVATRFYEHLKNNSGVVLPAELRLAIVAEAQFCSMECDGCADLPQTACLRPKAKIYDVLDGLKHTSLILKEDGDIAELLLSTSISESTKKLVVHVVHATVNHQGRVDQLWYDTVIQKLMEATDIIPKEHPRIKNGEKQRLLLAHSAFQEIAALSMVSSALKVTELMLSNLNGLSNFPTLPVCSDEFWNGKTKPQPLLLDWTSLFKTTKSFGSSLIRRDEKQLFGPVVYAGDIDRKSPEYSRLSQRAWKEATSLMYPMNPYFGLTMSGEDLYFVEELSRQFYLNGDMVVFCVSDRLDPKKYCAEHFSRSDSEFVAHHIAKAHNCAF